MNISMNKKYKTRDGESVRVLCTDRVADKPVVALIEGTKIAVYAADGRWVNIDEPDSYDLIEITPYDHLKIDDKVVVWSDEGIGARYRMHFAGVSAEGRPRTFSFGRTSYTQSDTTVWDQCELYCPVLHKDI